MTSQPAGRRRRASIGEISTNTRPALGSSSGSGMLQRLRRASMEAKAPAAVAAPLIAKDLLADLRLLDSDSEDDEEQLPSDKGSDKIPRRRRSLVSLESTASGEASGDPSVEKAKLMRVAVGGYIVEISKEEPKQKEPPTKEQERIDSRMNETPVETTTRKVRRRNSINEMVASSITNLGLEKEKLGRKSVVTPSLSKSSKGRRGFRRRSTSAIDEGGASLSAAAAAVRASFANEMLQSSDSETEAQPPLEAPRSAFNFEEQYGESQNDHDDAAVAHNSLSEQNGQSCENGPVGRTASDPFVEDSMFKEVDGMIVLASTKDLKKDDKMLGRRLLGNRRRRGSFSEFSEWVDKAVIRGENGEPVL